MINIETIDDVKILKVSKPDELEGFKPYQAYIKRLICIV